MTPNKVSAIICAAGKGERAGFNKNKLLAPLYGEPVLYHTLKKFNIKEIDEVIVTSSKSDFEEISALCSPFGFKVVTGGQTRTQSVKNALEHVTGEIVVIHDGARPFVSEQLILNCIACANKFGSGIAALNFTDTAVYAQYGEICDRLDRNFLFTVQTPQAFNTEDLKHAYSCASEKTYTDDSAVYGEFIAPPRLIEGDRKNIKLTYASDFPQYCPTPTVVSGQRIGLGVDVHTFGEGFYITLGGEKTPCDKGLIAHSDGDVLVHAVMDAILSAAGLKDIGHYFPDNDESYKNADSLKLLEKVVNIINEKDYKILNISASVQAEKPKLAPHIDNMRANLSKVCKIPVECIAVAAGTCEGLGFVGEGLGITAYVTVLLQQQG